MSRHNLYRTLTFFNEDEARTIDTMSMRLIPSDTTGPGAVEANTIVYIDRALSGFFSHLQVFYRQGIEAFNSLCVKHHGLPFDKLTEQQQDRMLCAIEGRPHNTETKLAQFFAVVREHTLEGFFGDPIHGGNHNGVGWSLIGFPGTQWGYTAEQMAANFDARTMSVLTLADISGDNEARS